MTYEYKEEIENHIICAPVHVDDELFDELEEVYAKAKVFDEILNVDYIVAPDDYAHEVTKIIDKYMEDK